jgi:hypothetical protein
MLHLLTQAFSKNAAHKLANGPDEIGAEFPKSYSLAASSNWGR